MTFNSYEFVLLFLPVFMAGYYIIRHVGRQRGNVRMFADLWIILGSFIFFGLFGMRNLAVLLISICFNVCTAIPMKFMRERGVSVRLFGRDIPIHQVWMTVGVTGNLVLLLFFKLWGVFLPIAISFYTFNQISYIVDLGRGEIDGFAGIDYLTYVLFFPKLLQGPIMGYEAFLTEIKGACEKRFDFEALLRGLYLFSIGLFKKVIMADTIGKAVDVSYSGLAGLGSLEAILAAVFYSFQLYFDFSGYCDMAAGISMMMGLELPINFDSPYKAVNIVDFWKRWHITLTRFFTKYLYIPLGGNRKGVVRTYINLMIVFLVSGFWHGTGWTFIIWGAMHGVLYVVTRALEGSKNSEKSGIIGFVKVVLTFIYVTCAWVFFRADTVGDALTLFKQMFVGGRRDIGHSFSGAFQLDELWYIIKVTPIMKLNYAWNACVWIFIAVSIIMIFFCPNAIRRSKECRIGVGTTLLTALLLIWCVVSFGGVSTFLYMNF